MRHGFTKKLLVVVGLAAATAGCGSSSTGSGGGNSVAQVKIGVLMPLSGPAADYGSKLRESAQFAADEINSAGGIKSLGGAKIVLDFADTESDPAIGVAAAQRLISQDNVDGIIGAYNSSVSLPVTALAEKAKVPIVIFSSVNDAITTRGFKYTFRPNENADAVAKDIQAYFDEMQSKTGKKISAYSQVYENTDFGKGTAAAFNTVAQGEGWHEASSDTFDIGVADVTPIAIKLKSLSPPVDLIFTSSDPPETNLIYQTFDQQGVKAPLMLDYAGASQNDFNPLLSTNEGMLQVAQWNTAVEASRPWLKPHVDAFVAAHNGAQPEPEGMQAYSDVYIWADALERAGSLDKTKLRDALAATNITPDSHNPALMMPYASIKFGPDGQNPDAGLMLLQVHSGNRVAVWPDNLRPSGYTPTWLP
jgi:branched-chain amino acid transport system substrate-binding protein